MRAIPKRESSDFHTFESDPQERSEPLWSEGDIVRVQGRPEEFVIVRKRGKHYGLQHVEPLNSLLSRKERESGVADIAVHEDFIYADDE